VLLSINFIIQFVSFHGVLTGVLVPLCGFHGDVTYRCRLSPLCKSMYSCCFGGGRGAEFL